MFFQMITTQMNFFWLEWVETATQAFLQNFWSQNSDILISQIVRTSIKVSKKPRTFLFLTALASGFLISDTGCGSNSIDAVNTQSTSSGGHSGKNDVDITFAFMLPAWWQLSVNSVYCGQTCGVVNLSKGLKKYDQRLKNLRFLTYFSSAADLQKPSTIILNK